MAITPQVVAQNNKLVKSRKLDFPVLFDENNQYADQLDLKHGFPDDLKEVYSKFGIDVASSNGVEAWELPIPGRFVIDRQGIVRSASVNADYTVRPEPAETVEFVRGM